MSDTERRVPEDDPRVLAIVHAVKVAHPAHNGAGIDGRSLYGTQRTVSRNFRHVNCSRSQLSDTLSKPRFAVALIVHRASVSLDTESPFQMHSNLLVRCAESLLLSHAPDPGLP